jgi:hypothetical protein
MQAESVPAPTTVPETSQPIPPVPLLEPAEPLNAPLPPASEEGEQPIFHVMQPPPPAPIISIEPAIPPPSTTYTQLIAVPIVSDPPMISNTTTTSTNKQTKRVCIFYRSIPLDNIISF